MAKGKQTCKILKEIRKQIAEENDINLVIEECTYKGDCLGTCPRCEAEVRYLERELEKRQRLGKVAMIAGVSLGTMLSATSCDSTEPMTREPLAGDVIAEVVDPKQPETSRDTTEELPPLMGIVRMFRQEYSFDSQMYQEKMKDLFVYPKMENLSVISGVIEYEHVGEGNVCSTFEELVAATKEFRAPYYPDGEQQMLESLSLYLSDFMERNSPYSGEMEVAFTVDEKGGLSDIVVQKGIDEALDAKVVSFFEPMEWHPACCQLKDEDRSWPFV